MKHKLLLLFLIGHFAFSAAIPFPEFSRQWHTQTAYLTNSAADVTTADSYIDRIFLSNVTVGAVTVTIKDKSTNCGGSACQLLPTFSIAANSIYVSPDLGGLYAAGGIQWQASANTSIVGWIKGKYPQA